MRVLLTGAAGFIGSHLVDALLRDDHEVIGVDNCLTGNIENIDQAKLNPRFRLIHADICELPIPKEPLDLVLHFASPASPVQYGRLPIETLRVNSLGTLRCCEIAREGGARLLYASTSEVYGDPLEHPQSETYWGNVNPNGTRSCYDEGKRFGEAAVFAYKRRYGIDARIVRLFNTYGPRMQLDDGRVVPTFIAQAIAGLPLTVFGSGEQTRSLCYVDDVVDAILRFASLEIVPYDVINIGSDEEVPIRTIAAEISAACDVPLKVVFDELPPDDPTRRRPDLRRVRSTLNWTSTTRLRDGLKRTVEWYRDRVPA